MSWAGEGQDTSLHSLAPGPGEGEACFIGLSQKTVSLQTSLGLTSSEVSTGLQAARPWAVLRIVVSSSTALSQPSAPHAWVWRPPPGLGQ